MSTERKTFRVSEQVPPKFTVTELVNWCHDRDLDPDVVTISGGHFVWMRTETDEQREKRETWDREREASHEQWIRDQYAKLTGKAGGTS